MDIYDTKLITEEFAKHFSSVGSTYANRITKPHTTFIEYFRNIPNNPSSIFMNPTNRTEIERLIENCPTRKVEDMMTSPTYYSKKSSYPLAILLKLYSINHY